VSVLGAVDAKVGLFMIQSSYETSSIKNHAPVYVFFSERAVRINLAKSDLGTGL
jgi:hypothetical protein